MRRKMLGVLTAVAAAISLVGVAWASGDGARDVSSSDSVAVTTASSGSAPSTNAGTAPDTTDDSVAGTSGESSSSVTIADTTGTTVDDNGGTTNTTIDDHGGTTGTTVDDHGGTTGTSVDDHGGTTGTTVDDHDDDEEETRAPAPVNSEAKSYLVGDAGSVAVQVVDGHLVLLDVSTNAGWSSEVEKADGDDVEVEFENGDSKAGFEAKLRDGQIRIEIEKD